MNIENLRRPAFLFPVAVYCVLLVTPFLIGNGRACSGYDDAYWKLGYAAIPTLFIATLVLKPVQAVFPRILVALALAILVVPVWLLAYLGAGLGQVCRLF